MKEKMKSVHKEFIVETTQDRVSSGIQIYRDHNVGEVFKFYQIFKFYNSVVF